MKWSGKLTVKKTSFVIGYGVHFYYVQEPPQFDPDEVAALERDMLEARERQQADLRDDSYRDIVRLLLTLSPDT